MHCSICSSPREVDRHHEMPKRMGGSWDKQVHAQSNLLTLCRRCHRNVHEGGWVLEVSETQLKVTDRRTGAEVMRRFIKTGLTPAPSSLASIESSRLSAKALALLHSWTTSSSSKHSASVVPWARRPGSSRRPSYMRRNGGVFMAKVCWLVSRVSSKLASGRPKNTRSSGEHSSSAMRDEKLWREGQITSTLTQSS